MGTTLSVRIGVETKRRLEALAKRSKRTRSFLAAEAISAYVEAESWQLAEIEAGIQGLDAGKSVSHEKISRWLRSWGRRAELKAPRG